MMKKCDQQQIFRKIMCRYIGRGLLTFMFAVMFACTALAATGQISFSDPAVTTGDEVNVTMKVSSSDGTLSRADITIGYDAKLLEFVSGTDADGGAGTVRVHGATNGAGTGTLEYNLKFKTLGAGTAIVTIGTQEVYDSAEQLVDIQHEGTSTITISAPATASKDSVLKSLNVSPGALTPEFNSDVTSYEVVVGTDVDVLAVNAETSDPQAKVSISGNEALQMGENTVTITVTAADGTTQTSYTIKALKQEGGASVDSGNETTETVNEGVKLSTKEKTITIMNPGSDVEIPDGFAESSINIDGHDVRGWVWGAETEPQYCIVYGMNDAGELHFYRYDLSEKTLQRYFEDPIQAELAANAEKYPVLVEEYDHLVASYNRQFLLTCILGIAALLLVIVIIVLLKKTKEVSATQFSMNSVPKNNHLPKQKSRGMRTQTTDAEDETIDISRVSAVPDLSKDEEDLGVTQVIRKPAQKADPSHEQPKTEMENTARIEIENLDEDEELFEEMNIEDIEENSSKIQPEKDEKKKGATDQGIEIEDL